MNVLSVENCGDDNVVTIASNFSAHLSPDCILTSIGCMHSKGFKEAKVSSVQILYEEEIPFDIWIKFY